MPAALYPRRGDYEFVTPTATGHSAQHLSQPLLCGACEKRFNRNGESEALRAIAPKSLKRFPLHEQMRWAPPREVEKSSSRFAGYELGLDMDQFAYFAVSVVWRGAAAAWRMPDGRATTPLVLGGFEPPIREYLLGHAPFPPDTAVIVIAGSDRDFRRSFFLPTSFVEAHCLNFSFVARGVFFRRMMGHHLSHYFRDFSCTSPRKCIFYADLARRTREPFGTPAESGAENAAG